MSPRRCRPGQFVRHTALGRPAGLITARAVSITACCHLETPERGDEWLLFSLQALGFLTCQFREATYFQNIYIFLKEERKIRKTGDDEAVSVPSEERESWKPDQVLRSVGLIVYSTPPPPPPLLSMDALEGRGQRSSFIRWRGSRRAKVGWRRRGCNST